MFVYLFSLFYFFPLRRFAFQGARTKRERVEKTCGGGGGVEMGRARESRVIDRIDPPVKRSRSRSVTWNR